MSSEGGALDTARDFIRHFGRLPKTTSLDLVAKISKGRKLGFQKLASFRLEILSRLSERHADVDYRRKVGLGILQCRILGLVGSNGKMAFKDICRDTGIEKSHASRLVASLIDLGLFRRTSDPADQRSIILEPTAKGGRLHKKVLDVALERNDRWLEALSAEQREAFLVSVDILTQQARKLAVRIQSSKMLAPSASPRAPANAKIRHQAVPVKARKKARSATTRQQEDREESAQ